MTQLFGREIEIGKATGARTVGAQPMPTPDQRAISTALENVSRQQSMSTQPDPTLGAPFSSFPDNRLTVAQMGPGEPAENFPLGGDPRQWKYRVGWNFPTTPDTDRGIDGELLRTLADSFWLLRRCIEIRKAELCALEWQIVPRGATGKEKKANGKKHEALIQEVTEFFRYPEAYFEYDPTAKNPGYGGRLAQGAWVRRPLVDWFDWMNALTEDYFVGDWVSLWPQRTLGNRMLGLRRVDGQHIKALLDLDGRLPPPPMPAWQQYLYGVPRASWAANEFYYFPRNVRNMTPYGFSHVQQALILINMGLRFDMWNTAAYTESKIPMGFLETPEGLTVDQIRDIADFLNGQVNTLAERQMVHPVPAGTKWQAIKPFVFDEKFAMYVIETICGAMDVQPQELGFAPSRSGMGGSGFADGQNEIHRRKSLIPTARWLAAKLTRIINEQWRDQGGADLEFSFPEIVSEDLNAKYEANEKAIMSGQINLDMLWEDEGEDAIGIGRVMQTTQGFLFLDQGLALTQNGMIKLEPPPDPSLAPTGTGPPGAPSGNPPGTDPTDGSKPPAPFQDMVKAAYADIVKSDDGNRKKTEEAITAFLLLWRKWWRDKIARAKASKPSSQGKARDALHLTRDEQNDLAQLLQTHLRGPVYRDAMETLREDAKLPHGPSTTLTRSDELRLQTRSQTHMVDIAQTYHTDLDTAYDRILAETAGMTDEEARQYEILRQLSDWLQERTDWKGQQIGTTEATNAQAQAAQDFQVQNPRILREWRWRAHMDQKTCQECRTLDGQIIGPNGPWPPAHVNCRCVLVPAASHLPESMWPRPPSFSEMETGATVERG
ncbi:MAG: phage portal protein [Bacilli bacterium]